MRETAREHPRSGGAARFLASAAGSTATQDTRREQKLIWLLLCDKDLNCILCKTLSIIQMMSPVRTGAGCGRGALDADIETAPHSASQQRKSHFLSESGQNLFLSGQMRIDYVMLSIEPNLVHLTSGLLLILPFASVRQLADNIYAENSICLMPRFGLFSKS